MTEKNRDHRSTRQPVGFTPRSTGLAGEYAREQGWGLNEDERTKPAVTKQDFDGGIAYDYGARDFGDSAKDTSKAHPLQAQPQSHAKRSPTKKGSHGRS